MKNKYLRRPVIVSAEPKNAMDYLTANKTGLIDGGRKADYRAGFEVVGSDGKLSWVEKSQFEKEFVCENQIELVIVDQLISEGQRSLAKRNHPDVAGDHDKMVSINAAADWLRAKALSK